MDDSRSFINTMKSFPMNIEVIQDFTYNASKPPVQEDSETISIQMNQSMILLPENPCNLDWPIRVWDGLRWIKLIMGVMN
jgi:hypothetical protein